jgi:hypothetical protein
MPVDAAAMLYSYAIIEDLQHWTAVNAYADDAGLFPHPGLTTVTLRAILYAPVARRERDVKSNRSDLPQQTWQLSCPYLAKMAFEVL